MPSIGWQNKGDKSVRRSPRRGQRKCARPFTAPRSVTKDKGKTVESVVEVITETENARDIEGREDEQPQVRVLTETGIGILASLGDAIPGFEDSQEAQADNILQDDPEQVQDRIEETAQVTATSDTTESSVEKTVVAKTVAPRKYKGWVIIPEPEICMLLPNKSYRAIMVSSRPAMKPFAI